MSQIEPLPGCDLPIFCEETEQYTLFYAPGCVVVTEPGSVADSVVHSINGQEPASAWSERIRQCAVTALNRTAQREQEPFQPECLTLYLHNQCNLRCTYCYTAPENQPNVHLEPAAVAAAADLVAASCQAKGLPLTIVLHGGGEPALFQDEVEGALAIVENAAQRYGLDLFRYIATNGVMPEVRARWLIERFDLIGLSCDGPPTIQDRQRPTANGNGSAASLMRTATLLRRAGKPFHVRATVTPDTVRDQAVIAAYICEELRPQEIHFEPVYMGGKTSPDSAFEITLAAEFVTHFLTAQTIAQQHGIRLTCSGSRIGTTHGAYCHVFRHVLNLVPPGVATACFKLTEEEAVASTGAHIGQFSRETQVFRLDFSHIQTLRHRLNALPSYCKGCFNCFHCTRDCPDHCSLDMRDENSQPGFRCHLQKSLAYHAIRSTADQLWRQRTESDHEILGTTTFY